ncbi:hypothetical protein DPMN_084618 [Dreissena polymorpha]|uniref:Uncharacterized protein n=1 Tax=Dreissena polymorpha TaxID=45954 RepID=A0A9D4BC61_DREPO|nr:hypothetical protein DPMN_084618 [Dreissena polymorpha]
MPNHRYPVNCYRKLKSLDDIGRKKWATFINILTKFHKDWMKTVTSIVYTSDLINILTKFHKDWMETVTSTVYTNKLLTDAHTHDGHGTSHGHISSPCHFMTVAFESQQEKQSLTRMQLLTKFGEDRMNTI